MLLISPLLLLIALAVKFQPRPVLFRQQRYGLDGKPFAVYKFRSMRVLKLAINPASAGHPR